MKKNKKFLSTLAIFFLLLLNFVSFSPGVARAFSCSFPGTCTFDVAEETNDALDQVLTRTEDIFSSAETRYGFTEDSWRVAQRKYSTPKVEIFFDNTNPKVGEKVTAHAMPEFFKNDPQNLYYTWYLIHTRNGTPQTATNSVDSGKREAARIMARGDYDPDLDGQNYASGSEDPDHDGWPSVDANSYDEDENAAPMGGADGVGGLESDNELSGGISRCYKHNFGTNNPSSGSADDSSGTDVATNCNHKWEDASGYTSGSGKFSTGEEEYWETDPADPDTDGDGSNDEADVLGLGQQDFTWTYQAGDRVGLVVEGTSMIPTEEENAYYKIMWGYPDVCDSTKTGLMDGDSCGDSGDYGYGFLATKSPSEQENEKLKISLAYSPDNPVADPSSQNEENIDADGSILDADQISVTSSLDNTQYDPDLLYYTWQIQRGDPQTDEWGRALDIDDNFDTTSGSTGLGITDFSFTPKKKVLTASNDDIVYFKVTATVAQASGVETNRGRSSVVIAINKNGVKIDLFEVNVSNGQATRGEKICAEGLYAALCPAVKGQMVAAKISGSRYTAGNSEFAWQTNGNTLNTPENVSDFFDGWSDTAVFFPVTKQEQQLEEISVTVTPKDALEPVKAGRLVTVVEPVALIRSSDTGTAWPKVQTVKSRSTKDSSFEVSNLNMLETYPGSDVSLYLDFVPYYLLADDENTVVDWQFGGTSISDESFEETYGDLNVLTVEGTDLSFTAPETVGAYYDISTNLKKYWSRDEANIMLSAWDIAPRSLESDRSVTITTIEEPTTDTTGLTKPTQLLAAIGTHLPHYVMYNLRLALTVLVMLFSSFWLYALIQKATIYEES